MYTSYRWLIITNVSNKATNFIYHKECGENKIYFSDLKFRAKAYASDGERKLIVDSITEIQPNFIQVCKIHFGKNLMPGESIRIFYRLDWPGEALSFYKGELSTSISLTRYNSKKRVIAHRKIPLPNLQNTTISCVFSSPKFLWLSALFPI